MPPLTPLETQTYEDTARSVISQWITALRHTSGTPVDISRLASLFAFDHIGAVGYSKDFSGLRTGETCRLWRAVKALFDAMGVAGALTWPVAALAGGPSFGMKREFEDAGVELVEEREKVGFISFVSCGEEEEGGKPWLGVLILFFVRDSGRRLC